MQTLSDNDAPKKSWLLRHGVTLLLSLGLLVGIGLLVYPTFSDWWNQYHQSRAIATYQEEVVAMDDEDKAQQLNDAYAYNRQLLEAGALWNMNDSQRETYNDQLDFASNGVMGYVTITKIGVQLPIYHGTDEKILQTSIGHLEGTSLPVGCESFDPTTNQVIDATEGTHCALTGHRGLPSAKLFSNLDKIVEGDTFTISVLDETLTYQVDQIRIVLPEDLSDLQIEAGQDYCTLVTCTPYGVNTHRLLVRGHRVNSALDADSITPDALKIPRYIAIPAAGVPMLFVFLVGMLLHYRKQRARLDERQEIDEILERISELESSSG